MSANPHADKGTVFQGRLTWIDACRIFAALGVVLIHSTTDSAGEPFAAASVSERVGPVAVRLVSELSGAEIFIVLSLFLLAWKLDRRDRGYRATVLEQGRRLLTPFVAWTVFYAFFRLVKASHFGYASAITTELASPNAWIGYLLLGNAQYHLHFMPTLFALILLYPLMRGAMRFPSLGWALVLLIYAMSTVQGWLWGHVTDRTWLAYLDRLSRIGGFTGYGLAGFALYGFWKRGLDQETTRLVFRAAALFTGIAFLVSLVYGADIARTGRWVVRADAAYYAHFLMPVLVFTCFLGLQYQKWPASLGSLARLTYGVYLVHPIFIALYDVALLHLKWNLSPTLVVLSKYLLTAPLSFALAHVLARIPQLAWLIGADRAGPAAAPVAAKPTVPIPPARPIASAAERLIPSNVTYHPGTD